MKIIFFSIICVLCISVQLNAQQFKTDRSVSDQLKNNSADGLRYAPATSQKSASRPAESMATSLKKGKAEGVKFAPGTGQTTEKKHSKPADATAKAVELPSSKTFVKADSITVQKPVVIKGQGDVTYEQADEQNKKQAAKEMKPVAVPLQ